MAKMVAVAKLKDRVCKVCGIPSYYVVGGNLEGFVRFHCRHAVWEILRKLLNEEIKVRKKPIRVAQNPNGRKAKARKRKA